MYPILNFYFLFLKIKKHPHLPVEKQISLFLSLSPYFIKQKEELIYKLLFFLSN